MKEKTITIRPYDYDAQQRVFALLFHGSGMSREDGLTEIPAASYQLVISSLELIK